MKKLFRKILIVLSLLCFGNAFAQQVVYSLQAGNGQHLGQMVFNYKSTGYEARMNGEKLSFEVNSNTAITTMGKLVIVTQVDGSYYHNHVGYSYVRPVTTSFGDSGFAKMFYAGLTPNGRLYREELWLNGRLFSQSETVIDHNDQIVWSVGTDADGTLRITRM